MLEKSPSCIASGTISNIEARAVLTEVYYTTYIMCIYNVTVLTEEKLLENFCHASRYFMFRDTCECFSKVYNAVYTDIFCNCIDGFK